MNLDRAIRKESWLANETFRLHLIRPSYRNLTMLTAQTRGGALENPSLSHGSGGLGRR